MKSTRSPSTISISKPVRRPPRSRPYIPKPKSNPEAAGAESGGIEGEATEVKAAPSEVILYMTSWCGYCRKTSRLLKSLDVAFVQKNIERDRAAAKEYRRKAQGYRGIPLLDFEGRIIRGYNEKLVRQLVKKRKQNETSAD